MFNVRQTDFEGGDCTAPYAVELEKEYTVQEFVTAVLSKSEEWGYIGIEHKLATFGKPYCEYKYGQLLYELPKEILNKKVVSARAHGGYTRMDYYLTVDSTESEKRKKLIETLKRIITDLEKGCDGFMYLYDILCEADKI